MIMPNISHEEIDMIMFQLANAEAAVSMFFDKTPRKGMGRRLAGSEMIQHTIDKEMINYRRFCEVLVRISAVVFESTKKLLGDRLLYMIQFHLAPYLAEKKESETSDPVPSEYLFPPSSTAGIPLNTSDDGAGGGRPASSRTSGGGSMIFEVDESDSDVDY